MIVWFALLVPLATAAILYWRFQHRIAWWELGVLAGAPALLIVVSKAVIEASLVHDMEFRGGWATETAYFEDWNERVECRHPKYRTESYTGSDGQQHTHRVFDGFEHFYDVDYHPPKWRLYGSNGETFSITRSDYEQLVTQFGGARFVELNRSFHTDDGDKYVATWPKDDASLEPITTTNAYENRVAVADSVYRFPAIDAKTTPVYEYPGVAGWYQSPIAGGTDHAAGRRALALLNAKLGASCGVRHFACVWKNQSLQVAVDQESYWNGGNRNELVSCVGVDDASAVQWAYVFGWTKSESLKADARAFLVAQRTLDLSAYATWLAPEVQARFRPRDFAEFSYLTVEPPGWAVVMVYILTALACGGLGAWVVLNQIPGEVLAGDRKSS